MSDLVERLQQSAHLTADDNAAHALHSAVVEIRKLGAALQHSQTLLADTQKRLAVAERHRCGGMIDDMATYFCGRPKGCDRQAGNGINGGAADGENE